MLQEIYHYHLCCAFRCFYRHCYYLLLIKSPRDAEAQASMSSALFPVIRWNGRPVLRPRALSGSKKQIHLWVSVDMDIEHSYIYIHIDIYIYR